MSLHGQQQYVKLQPPFKDPRWGGGEPGTYKVVFTFARPGFSLCTEGNHTIAQELQGDSHVYIRIKPDTKSIVLSLRSAEGNFEFLAVPNERGCLGKIIAETIAASDFFEAERKAWDALSPALSWIASYLDVPLHIYQADVINRLPPAGHWTRWLGGARSQRVPLL